MSLKKPTIKIPTEYKLARINTEGETEFYHLDRYSGGYPCWISSYSSAESYEDRDEVVKIFQTLGRESYMTRNSQEYFLITCVPKVEVQDISLISNLEKEMRFKALNKLTTQEKRLLGIKEKDDER